MLMIPEFIGCNTESLAHSSNTVFYAQNVRSTSPGVISLLETPYYAFNMLIK